MFDRNDPHPFDCCECGEPFQIGKGFVHDCNSDDFWCELCFREMAWREYGVR